MGTCMPAWEQEMENARTALAGPHRERAAVFSSLLDRSVDRHLRLSTLILGNRADAEDALNDAALRAWQHFASLRDADRFDAWFSRILVNVCRDRLRDRHRPVALTAEPVSRLDPYAASVERAALVECLGELTPEHRAVIALHYLEGLPVEEIAEQLGIRAGTVKSRLHYGLSALRAAYEAASRDTGRAAS